MHWIKWEHNKKNNRVSKKKKNEYNKKLYDAHTITQLHKSSRKYDAISYSLSQKTQNDKKSSNVNRN